MASLSLRQLSFLVILRVTFAAPWDTVRPPRYEGYDLERGPVLYEAYYPEEEAASKQPSKLYQEKRFFDRPTVEERSYQISDESYDFPYQPDVMVPRKRYSPSSSAHFSAVAPNNPQNARLDEYLRFDQPNRDFESRDAFALENTEHAGSMIVNGYPFTGGHSNSYYPRNDVGIDDSTSDSRQVSYNRREIPQHFSANDDFTFNPETVNEAPIFEEPYEHSGQIHTLAPENLATDYHRQKMVSSLPMENIFQPRPQTINYIFSENKNLGDLKPDEFSNVPDENDWPRNYGDNLINEEIRKADEQELKNEEAKVASIMVSKVPHHKTRHHHGDLPRREYGRQ